MTRTGGRIGNAGTLRFLFRFHGRLNRSGDGTGQGWPSAIVDVYRAEDRWCHWIREKLEAVLLYGIGAGQSGQGSRRLLKQCIRNEAFLRLVHAEYAFRNAARGITVWIAVALVESTLKNARAPSIVEISVQRVPDRVAIREYKRLIGYHCLVSEIIKGLSIPVHLEKYTGERNRVRRVIASPTIWTCR